MWTHRKAAVLWIIQNELLILLGGSKILLWTKINTKIYSKKKYGSSIHAAQSWTWLDPLTKIWKLNWVNSPFNHPFQLQKAEYSKVIDIW